MSKAQAQSKIALALDLIRDASDLISEDSNAYLYIKNMEDVGNKVYSELQHEAIAEQAERLVNFRGMTA